MPRRLQIPEFEIVLAPIEDVEEVKKRWKDFISEIGRSISKRHIAETSKMAEQQNVNVIEKG